MSYLQYLQGELEVNHAWIITFDHLYKVKLKTMGPRNAPETLFQRLLNGEGIPFRIYDDDKELYFTGRMLCDEHDHPARDWCENFFAPLTDFGTPDSGATEIRYPNDVKKWVQL